ncbi:hypothetical protein CMQ_7799 [Grosmannia clavigera kw1407]|uniref:Uncharacterized protein n=1 Tax=Grosmannia clavigera (strain kw1407 / UAMH 11150) TaxID=655863 RepID=F0XS80_GROCL|nr:uncharacterized protein CMQ_7799 [Grosmannia clavigera kw1407]EFW99431.1 hypothetical protein CMQ_7799 [Grosmannia clavigera kw1407]
MGVIFDPQRFQERTHRTFPSEAVEAFGITESKWEPISDNELLNGCTSDYIFRQKRQKVSIHRDLRNFRPTRLEFHVPHPDTDMNNDWFVLLFVTLHNLIRAFCHAHFRSEMSKPAGNEKWSPWETAMPPQFLHYAAEISRKDDYDGGWEILLIDPRQRSHMVMGIVAKVLEEHVTSDLLFGASEHHHNALSAADRNMLQEEGYFRKFKRSEEVRQILDGEILTPRFWEKVDHLTAGTAAMLLPLFNIQRQLAVASHTSQKQSPRTGILVMYQQLHDIIALAGYASICMAWSPSIFKLEFPEPGQQLDHSQDRVDDEYVFGPSLKRAIREDKNASKAANTPSKSVLKHDSALFNRIAKIKIVLWPAIRRYKPHWGMHSASGKRIIDGQSGPNAATVTVLTKSQNVYYAGKNTGAADTDEGLPTLAAHSHRLLPKEVPMDAHGLLRSQGWRGLGYTLHATDDNVGLARPLLLSRKDDRLGLGSQSVHSQAAATNQWWLDAFDQQLKGLTAGKAAPANTPNATAVTRLELLSAGGRGSNKYRGAYGLYASFVRGGLIEGTISSPITTSTNSPTPCSSQDEAIVEARAPESGPIEQTGATKKGKKRKTEEENEETKKRQRLEKKERKEKKRIKREQSEADSQSCTGKIKDRTPGKSGNEEKRDKLAASSCDKKEKKDQKRRRKELGTIDGSEGLDQAKTIEKSKQEGKLQGKDDSTTTQSDRVVESERKATTTPMLLDKRVKRKEETKAERKARRKALSVSLDETKEQRRESKSAEKKLRRERRAVKEAAKKAKAEAKTA